MQNELWEQAIAEHQREQWAVCLETLEKLLKVAPQHLEALRLRGDVLRRLGEPLEAIAAYQQAVSLAPNSRDIQHELGRLLWQQGDVVNAETCFRAVLQLTPEWIQGYADLGVALQSQGKWQEAIAVLQQGVEMDRDRADLWAFLGAAYAQSGDWAQGKAAFAKSLALRPDDAATHGNYGAMLAQSGETDAALSHYEQAIALQPDMAHAHSNLGVLLKDKGRLQEGIAYCRRAVELNPNLAEAYSNLSLLLKENGDIDEAVQMGLRALELNPQSVNACNNLGNALQEKNELNQAIAQYERAIGLQPKDAKAYNNMANALQRQDALAEAIQYYEQALVVQPDYAIAHNNLGNALSKRGDVTAAIASYERSIAIDPNYAEGHFHLGMALLLSGNLRRGFAEYEWRWQMEEFLKKNPITPFVQPQWDGSELAGKRVLLYNEQGMGDRIQFIRYAQLIEARGGKVVYECPKPFYRLFATFASLHHLVPEGYARPPFDYYVPLQSLPHIFGTTLDTIPAPIPYLFPPADANPELLQCIRSQGGDSLRNACQLKIGLVWASSLAHKTSPRRSCPLSLLLSLLDLPHVQGFSLQKEMSPEDEELLAQQGDRLVDLRPYLTDFAETAAAIAALDLVISVDTAVAHLAGAMGKPIWVLLPSYPDWRWLLGRDDSPWYPTVQLFRQTEAGAWEGAIANIQTALQIFVPTPLLERESAPLWARNVAQVEKIVATLQQQEKSIAILQETLKHYQAKEFAVVVEQCERLLANDPDCIDALNLIGVATYKLGQIEPSIAYYRHALHIDSQRADVLANLGLILERCGRYDEAITTLKDSIALNATAESWNHLGNAYQGKKAWQESCAAHRQAIALDAKQANYHYNLGIACKAHGDLEEAIASFTQALALNPHYIRAHVSLGSALNVKGRSSEAIVHYQQALALDPNQAVAYLNMGNALVQQKRWEEAQQAFQQAINLDPNLVEAYRSQAGLALEHKQPQTAITCLQKALELTPNCPDTQINLAVALVQDEQYAAAKSLLENVLRQQPDRPEVHVNLGTVYSRQENHDLAIFHFQRAIALRPKFISAWLSLGLAFAFQEHLEEASAAFYSVLEFEPNHPDCGMNFGITMLALGSYQLGWQYYERRHDIEEYKSRRHVFTQPIWDGRLLPDKTLLIYTEQGLGDAIQFMRYLPLIRDRVGRLVIECNQSALCPLLASIGGVDAVIAYGDPLPVFDYHYPLMSLPYLLGTTLETIPCHIPYLEVSSRNLILPAAAQSQLKVGIVWTANIGNRNTGKRRTIPLTTFQSLFDVKAVQFYSLQKEIAGEELEITTKWNVIDLTSMLNELMDTAALITQLDLVITVDTMVGHLAGALGKPAWVILPFAPDWRWLLERDDSPWYPTLRLFRTRRQETWYGTLQRVKLALEQEVRDRTNGANLQYCRKILAGNEHHAGALNNLAVAELQTGAYPEAIAHLQQALLLQPDFMEAQSNLATALLNVGNLHEGLALYESRWQVEAFRQQNRPASLDVPRWDGSDLEGKTIFVYPEQGIGDRIQFARFLPLLQQRGCRVIFGCDRSLYRLFTSCAGIDVLVSDGDALPKCDCYITMGSLPYLLGMSTLAHLPHQVPYLSPPAASMQKLATLINHPPHPKSLKVGLVWQTRSTHPTAHQRSCAIAHWLNLLQVPGVQFLSLQKNATPNDLELLHSQGGDDLANQLDDFADTAAAIAHLDLIICIDTAVAHLAGALAKPVWVILPHLADWRWLLERDDSPWYPTLRLFRQSVSGDWREVCDRVATALQQLRVATPFTFAERQEAQQHFDLGVTAYQQGNMAAALHHWRTASAADPSFLEASLNLGSLLGQQQRLTEAIDCFQSVMPFHRDRVELKHNLARAYFNLGNACRQQERFAAAIVAYQEATILRPDFAKAYTNLGCTYERLQDLDAAIAAYRHAIELHPASATAHNNIATVLQQQQHFDEAIAQYQMAISLQPDSAEAYSGASSAYRDKGEVTTALSLGQQAIAIDPSYANAHFNLAFSLLLSGRLREGFMEYEWRFLSSQFRAHGTIASTLPGPRWDGSPFVGKTLLILMEQGIGDQIQFIRYVKVAKNRGGKVLYFCSPELVQLFATMPELDGLIENTQPLPAYDLWISLLSLPHIFATTLETIPQLVPYLHAPIPSSLTLPCDRRLRIGLVWASRSDSSSAGRRSCALTDLAPILALPYLFVNLQKEVTEAEEMILRRYASQRESHADHLLDARSHLQDFAATAAIIAQLDLIITVDTAVVHLAGALGKPTWLLLAFVPDWRWLLERDDSPWYPNVRLFRQPQAEDWQGAIAQITQALQTLSQRSYPPQFDVALAHYQSGQHQLAQRLCQEILVNYSTSAEAHHLLGVLYAQEKQAITALSHLWQAVKLQPDDVGILQSLGSTLFSVLLLIGNAEASLPYLHRALQLEPQHINTLNTLNTLNNIGTAYSHLNFTTQSIEAFQAAIAIQPDNAQAHFGLALNLLKQGHWRQGWAEYEWRWQRADFLHDNPLPSFDESRWDGSSLDGKTILIWSEQGLGDQLQFLRYLTLVRQQGAGQIIYTCVQPLQRLVSELAEVDVIIDNGAAVPRFDVWIPLLSLPHILGTTLETIPTHVPYLIAPRSAQVEVAALFSTSPRKVRIGLVWASKSGHETSPLRSISLAQFEPLFELANVEFFSLQKEVPNVDASTTENLFRSQVNLHDCRPYLCDFAATAAIIEQMDLVISVDTAVAHLAGALGKPVWICLHWVADGRWLAEREDTPWYPTARLFRQQQPYRWQDVVERLQTELQLFLEGKVQPLVVNSVANSAIIPKQPLDALVQSEQLIDAIVKTEQKELPKPDQEPLVTSGKTTVRRVTRQAIAIGWGAGGATGWGVFGLNLTLQLQRHRDYRPFLVRPLIEDSFLNPLYRKLLEPAIAEQQQFQQTVDAHAQQSIYLDSPVICALGNHFHKTSVQRFRGKQNIGFIFLEDTTYHDGMREAAATYDLILAGSSWNTQVLQKHGINNVRTVLQGIDPTLFHPAVRSNLFGDRFVIFSGGKLEFRKGQDIVIAAFREFRKRHPDALLVFAWHNFWTSFMHGMENTGHVVGLPRLRKDKTLEITAWLIENGLPSNSFIDLGLLPNYVMPQMLREADVAIFPNRSEGGTNLVAMECLACGVPTILSANTGHLDLIDPQHCYPLLKQSPVPSHPIFPGTEGWGESDLAEILEALEQIYSDRATANQKGLAAATFMQNHTWERQVERLLAEIPSC